MFSNNDHLSVDDGGNTDRLRINRAAARSHMRCCRNTRHQPYEEEEECAMARHRLSVADMQLWSRGYARRILAAMTLKTNGELSF
jgi:hypothetical protein